MHQKSEQEWGYTLAILILRRLRNEDCHEFKASLCYIVPGKAGIQYEPLSQKKKKGEKGKKRKKKKVSGIKWYYVTFTKFSSEARGKRVLWIFLYSASGIVCTILSGWF